MLLAKNPGLVNQHYILNEVSLNRNTPKIKLCVNQLLKILWPKVCRNLNSSLPWEQGSGVHGFSVQANSVELS